MERCEDADPLELSRAAVCEARGSFFSCDSDAMVPLEGELILFVFRNETFFVLLCLSSSSERSKLLMILALFFPALREPVFFFLNLRSLFKKSEKRKDKLSTHSLLLLFF